MANIDFMTIAKSQAALSDDWHTKVGAVFVKNGIILSAGCNTCVNGISPNSIPRQNGDKLLQKKNTYMVHAEVNALINYHNKISDFVDSTLYVTLCPCSQCAKMIIQLGVRKVIYLNEYTPEETEATKYLFNRGGVIYAKYSEEKQ